MKQIQCQFCGESVDPDLYHADTDQCIDCHDNSGLGLDECGCERCFDRAVAKADFGD